MPLTLTTPATHFGLMDGSAGIAISPDSFITVSDEENRIMSFSTEAGSVGREILDLNKQVPWFPSRSGEDGEYYEADIEGAAQIGEPTFWISSHSYHKESGKAVVSQVFFATGPPTDGGNAVPMGKIYQGLLGDLIAEESLKKYRLKEASVIKPKVGATAGSPGGLNIESLCAAADGKALFIGFRNPIPGGMALIVPLENPPELVAEGGNATAKFGKPIELKCGGLGLRDMIWWRGQYLIIAGHFDSHLNKTNGQPDPNIPPSVLYRWSGIPGADPVRLNLEPPSLEIFNSLNPEALIAFPDDRVLILSDDGGYQKDLKKSNPAYQLHFRSVWLA